MFAQNVEDSIAEEMTDINRTMAAYVRLRELADFQAVQRTSFKKSCCARGLLSTSSQETRANDTGFSSFVSSQGGGGGGADSSLLLMQVDEEDDEEMPVSDQEDDLLNSRIDFVDVNNNFTFGADSRMARPGKKPLLAARSSPEKVMEKIFQALNELKHQDIEEYLEYSTKFIQLHLGHNLKLDLNLFKLLFNCTNPAFVQSVFDQGLIEPSVAPHIGCLYERNFLFSAVDLSLGDEHSYAFDVLASLAVLIYKTNTSRSRRNIFTCLVRDFTMFVASDFYEENPKSVAVKCFLRALILTGTITLAQLNQFLSKYEPVDTSIDSDEDDESDSVEVFSSSEENSDSDTDGEPPHNRRGGGHDANRQPGGGGGGGAGGVNSRKTVGQYLNAVPNTTSDLCKMFPLTLKNQCRIAIKTMMPNYSLQQARKLRVLPSELQEFVLFNDEVERAIRLTKKLKSLTPPSS